MASRWEGETRFAEDGENVCVIAAALDPRFRKLKFLSSDDILKVQIKIQTLALQAKINEKEQLQQASVEQDDSARAQSGSRHITGLRLRGAMRKTVPRKKSGADNERVRNEVLMYFGEQCIARDKSPLQWWKENAARFPDLAVLAKSYLSVPAMSTPSERLFSAAGNIVTEKRASLTSEQVDMLTFLHSNV